MAISIGELLDISIFKCKHCKKRCQYPVMVADDKENYCRSCLNDVTHTQSEENKEINSILEKFQIPCRYNERGCDMHDKITELNKHEKTCYYRDKICPLYYLKECKVQYISDIYDHFTDEHVQSIIESGDDSVKLCFNIKNSFNLDIVRLLKVDHENFLLHVKTDEDNNSLLYALYFYGDVDDMKKYQCTIQQTNNDIQTTNKELVIQVESDFDVTINKDKAVSYDLDVLRRCFDTADTTIKITRKHAVSAIQNIDILNTLKCIRCKAYLRDEIRQCTSGHSACKECIIETTVCSTCNGAFTGTRNYTLESLCGLLKYPCSNRGCSKHFSAKNISTHEFDCPLKRFACPFREMFHCQVEGMHKDLIQHVKTEHVDKSVQNSYLERKLSISNIDTEVHCLIAFDTIFCFYLEKSANTYLFSCKYIGTKSRAKNFMFEIGLMNHLKKDNKLIMKNSWKKSDGDEIWVEMHDSNVNQYINASNEILLFYKIIKNL